MELADPGGLVAAQGKRTAEAGAHFRVRKSGVPAGFAFVMHVGIVRGVPVLLEQKGARFAQRLHIAPDFRDTRFHPLFAAERRAHDARAGAGQRLVDLAEPADPVPKLFFQRVCALDGAQMLFFKFAAERIVIFMVIAHVFFSPLSE